jgi:hypothetical protein
MFRSYDHLQAEIYTLQININIKKCVSFTEVSRRSLSVVICGLTNVV